MKKIEETIAKIPKCALDKSWEKYLKKYRKIICEIQGETLKGIPEQKKTPALILRGTTGKIPGERNAAKSPVRAVQRGTPEGIPETPELRQKYQQVL